VRAGGLEGISQSRRVEESSDAGLVGLAGVRTLQAMLAAAAGAKRQGKGGSAGVCVWRWQRRAVRQIKAKSPVQAVEAVRENGSSNRAKCDASTGSSYLVGEAEAER
jgi:hypothetical protein